MYKIDLNSDIGESFGAYSMGDDEAVMDVKRFPGLSVDLKKVFPARPPLFKVKAPVEDYG